MSQSLTKIYIHLVFSTKNRTDTLPKEHLNDVYSYIAQTLKAKGTPVIALGGTYNHIHILFQLSRSMSVSDIVRIVKSSSSKMINEKNGHYVPFAWQDGYGAFSVSISHVGAVKDYIASQMEHHAKVSFKDEFRRLCKKFEIDIDERYVWD